MNKSIFKTFVLAILVLAIYSLTAFSQEQPPAPSAPHTVRVPAVIESRLPNGLKVAVISRTTTPLVTITMLMDSGADSEDASQAGIADMTATLLTKGTKTRTATQIAEDVAFLGGSISSGAGWNSSSVSITVTSDKVPQAMAILSDLILNPVFDQKEIDLLRSQTTDGLAYNLKQPSFLANYVASKYIFNEHPAGGTPESIAKIDRQAILDFYQDRFLADRATLLFAGDITSASAKTLSAQHFAKWKRSKPITMPKLQMLGKIVIEKKSDPILPATDILVIDLPRSGQAAVSYGNRTDAERFTYLTKRRSSSSDYYVGSVLNSILGGGYSSRLNYEIRIKRGLSYGAGSSINWRVPKANFITRTLTKNESAGEVAELVIAELIKLTKESAQQDEAVPRKSVLTGDFSRDLETTGGLSNALAELYSFDLSPSELNTYINKINAVTGDQVKMFAAKHLLGGKIVIVGDYSIFKDDLAKRFPNMPIKVIEADALDLSRDSLQK